MKLATRLKRIEPQNPGAITAAEAYKYLHYDHLLGGLKMDGAEAHGG